MTEEFKNMLALAESGNADMQYKVARAYAYGDDNYCVEKDFNQALEWYDKAGQNGSLPAMHETALLYQEMLGENADPNMYVQIIMKAAQRGYAPSQLWLGETCYRLEQYENAAPWLQKAANCQDESISVTAKRLYAVLLMDGLGITQNRDKAFKLLSETCQSPDTGDYNSMALRALAICYHYGYGTAIDYDRARDCYNGAKRAGNTNVDRNLAQLEKDARAVATSSSSGINWGVAALLLLLFFPAGIIYILMKK